MSSFCYSPATIRDVWEKKAKQRWDGQTHGRGLCLLIIDVFGPQGAFKLGRPGSPHPRFEFWRDQNKIRGRFIGGAVGNGVVVAKLDKSGLLAPK